LRTSRFLSLPNLKKLGFPKGNFMTETTYYTVRICTPGQAPLAPALGHHFEYSHSAKAEAEAYIAAMSAKHKEYDYHLLRTTVTVLRTVGAAK